MNLEQLNMEKVGLENRLQVLIKENLDSKERKEEYEAELKLLESEIKELDSEISSLKKKAFVEANEYSYNKENKIFNKIIAANLIPSLSLGVLFIFTGNSHVISNLGGFSLLFTGIPTLLVSSGIYLSDLNNMRRENVSEYLNSDENKSLDDDIKSLEEKRLSAKDRIRDLIVEINKVNTSIMSNGYQIVSIKNRISDINMSIRTGNVVKKETENIKLVK